MNNNETGGIIYFGSAPKKPQEPFPPYKTTVTEIKKLKVIRFDSCEELSALQLQKELSLLELTENTFVSIDYAYDKYNPVEETILIIAERVEVENPNYKEEYRKYQEKYQQYLQDLEEYNSVLLPKYQKKKEKFEEIKKMWKEITDEK